MEKQALTMMGGMSGRIETYPDLKMRTDQYIGVVKGAPESYTFEHMEIPSYRVLIAAAEHLGDSAAAAALWTNLMQEAAMADWLADNIDQITRAFLIRDESGATAKR